MEYNQQLAEDLWSALENVELDMTTEFVESFVKPSQPTTIDVKPLIQVEVSPNHSPGASVPPSPCYTDYSESSTDYHEYPTPEEEVKPIVEDLMWLSQSVNLNATELMSLTPEQAVNALASNFTANAESRRAEQVNGDARPTAVTGASRGRRQGNSKVATTSGLLDLDEESLVNLPVRELNKRLQGCARDEILKIKQKRRTLKNRGYAQNCRTKRMMQRSELEQENRRLVIELAKLKADVALVSRERDVYRSQYETLRQRNASECSTLPSSPESVFLSS